MPGTLTAPVAVATAPGILLRRVALNVENGNIEHEAFYCDANGNVLAAAPPATMTHAAWLTAVQGASGSLKSRVYSVYCAQAGFTTSAIT